MIEAVALFSEDKKRQSILAAPPTLRSFRIGAKNRQSLTILRYNLGSLQAGQQIGNSVYGNVQVEVIGYVAATVILLFLFIVFLFLCGIAIAQVTSFFRGETKIVPKLAGTAIPETGEGLDISRRYDIVYCGDYRGEFTEILEGVRIVGYIGRDDDESVSKMYVRGRWLVVEFIDGRRAYVMPHSIVSLRESVPINPVEAPKKG